MFCAVHPETVKNMKSSIFNRGGVLDASLRTPTTLLLAVNDYDCARDVQGHLNIQWVKDLSCINNKLYVYTIYQIPNAILWRRR